MFIKKKTVCGFCGRKLSTKKDLHGFCVNKNCEMYDPIALEYDAPIEPPIDTHATATETIGVQKGSIIQRIKSAILRLLNQRKKCPICKTVKKDGRFCYNMDCQAYDPLSQYFEPPTKKEIRRDVKACRKFHKDMGKENEGLETELPW